MKQRLLLVIAAFLILILAACSSTEEETATPSKEAEPVTIQGTNGEVTLDAPAKKVVVLEWTYAEDLLAVGVQPAGMADIAEYGDYVNIEPQLDETVVDVGGRQEPNLEAIAALEPDLIIGVSFRHDAMIEQLETIAPTVIFNPYPEDESIDLYQEMETTFLEIAKAVGKTAEGEQVLTDLEAQYEEKAAEIEAANLKTKDVILTLAYSGAQAPEIRVFTPNSMASIILERIGLNNVHQPDQFEVFGSSTFNVEGLVKYEDANYLYTVPDTDNIYENQLKGNPVWENLAFVKEGRTYDLGADTWLYGGPLSAETLMNQITDVLVTD
ncbi:iron-siderophore ABC transporter substrate-binding protein [Microbacterium sp. APC 3898]|uniref:Iron-siderophore ABC transporter substrate-binding protein n=2 Tax=Planococcus TaxID=1372 RepID=A0ABT7ZKP1_9BACL|nr:MULTISPECIES: iron-siderophore ABC transporter substrate-binding protein [Terrabacteria group]MBD8014845.1 iron-siderophore ABC transporter substrate-binding protein [Planococcus wigleyi]MDN3427732.1 iron-siderophore ABC transporter substrate-binding protein [Planococcus sp. APC 4016]MDN3437086.1 iron-siderophore ABC transporter substrate-binding protein [Planococcus sp. APC 3900]MDN3499284.1 iron-siderophore ABC transporter substrate-binding protein [Microbacterium sp. APC 3898]